MQKNIPIRLHRRRVILKKNANRRLTRRHTLTTLYPCDFHVKGKSCNALVNTVVLNLSDSGAGLEIIGVKELPHVEIGEEILLEINTGASDITKIRARIKWAKLYGLKNSIGVEFIEQRDIEKILHVV